MKGLGLAGALRVGLVSQLQVLPEGQLQNMAGLPDGDLRDFQFPSLTNYCDRAITVRC